ncbi:MAG: hypothetical protein AB1896_10205 [Thermodesulfobacteriota bacterium]
MSGTDKEDAVGLEGLQSTLTEIVGRLRQSQGKQHKFRWWNRLATIAVLAVFILYIILFYRMFSVNLSSEKFQAGFQAAMGQLAPVITDASLEVLTEVSPVYVDLATKKAEEIMPTIMSSLEKQSDVFITNMSRFAQENFQARLDRLVKKVADEFRRQYPDLTDEQIERFIHESERDFSDLFLETAQELMDDTRPQIMEMKYLAESMTEGHHPRETMELYALFLHNLLLLLDREIMGE